jgi:hypothetical protein
MAVHQADGAVSLKVTIPEHIPETAFERLEHEGLHKVDKAAPIVGQVADAVSTIVVIKKGGKEQNPFMRPIAGNAPVLLVVKAAVGVMFAASGEVLAKNGHRKLGKGLAWFGAALGFGAAAHNMTQT